MTSTTMKWSQHNLSSCFSSFHRFVSLLLCFLTYKIFNFKLFLQLLLIVTSYVLHVLSELGVYRCPAFLPGNEELYSKKALQRKDNKDQDKLSQQL
jgi:hypothetical protein